MIYKGEHIDADLAYLAIHSCCSNIATLMEAFIVQLEESSSAQKCLFQWRDENDDPFFNVRAVNCFQNKKLNIYRVRPLGSILSRFRIIYAYDSEYDDFYLLAVIEKPPENENVTHDRVYNYEPNHFITQRVISEYDAYGIPKTV